MNNLKKVLFYALHSMRIQIKLAHLYKVELIGSISSIIVSSIIVYLIVTKNVFSESELGVVQFTALYLAGILRIAYGLVETFSESFWTAGSVARSGELTLLLVQPLPVSLQFTMRYISYERLLNVVVGVFFIVQAYKYPQLQFTHTLLLGLVCMFFSVLAFYSLVLLGAAVSIRALSNSGAFMVATEQFSEAGLFPTIILRNVLPNALISIFPISVATVFSEYLLGREIPQILIFFSLVSWVVLIFGAWHIWISSLKKYQGTGT